MSEQRTTAAGGMETSYGFRQVGEGEKQPLVNEVFHRVASRYDLMNDLMSGGMHRLWKEAHGRLAQPAEARRLDGARRRRRHRRHRVPHRRGVRRQRPCDRARHQRLDAGRRPRARRKARARWPTSISSRPMPRSCLSPTRAFDAYTIAFGIRNVPRIETALAEAYRVLKPGGRFLCLEFSEVDMPLLDRVYEAWSFNAIPRIGQIVAGDGEPYAYLVESIRKFPNQQNFAAMMTARRLRPRHLAQLFRRHRGAAFGLEALTDSLRMSSLGAGLRLVRAGWIMVREGVVAALPGDQLVRPAEVRLARRAAVHAGAARCAAAAASGSPTRSRGSGRPMSSSASSWRRGRTSSAPTSRSTSRCCRTAWRPSRRPRRSRRSKARSAGRSASSIESFGEPVAAASIAQVHPARSCATARP